jgi:hypothetical protein
LAEKKDSLGAGAAYRALYGGLATSTQGPWRHLSVQDGHHPGDADQNAALLLELGSAAVPGLLALHDFERSQRAVDSAFALGDDPTDSLPPEQALALQIIIATTDWPGDDLDRVLYYVQISLPPPVYRELGVMKEIRWEG